MTSKMDRKYQLSRLAHAEIVKFGETNPFWAKRAFHTIRWAGNRYAADCFYYDPNTGGKCTFATVYEGLA